MGTSPSRGVGGPAGGCKGSPWICGVRADLLGWPRSSQALKPTVGKTGCCEVDCGGGSRFVSGERTVGGAQQAYAERAIPSCRSLRRMGSISGSRPTCPGTSATSESSTAWPRCWCVSGVRHAAPWWWSRVSSPVGRPSQGQVGTRLSPEPPGGWPAPRRPEGRDWGRKPGLGLHSALPAQLCGGRRRAAPGPGLAGASGTFCFPQQKSVSRRKCAACKIVVHTPCIEQLEKVSVAAQAFLPLPSEC